VDELFEPALQCAFQPTLASQDILFCRRAPKVQHERPTAKATEE
jgi:hypothetical protein